MKQHPVPQQISSYEFKLVGDMTLKQFFQVASGVLVAFLFWITPLPVFIKFPLAAVSVILGLGLAFVPLYGRPLSAWILAFIRAVYSPTIYIKGVGAAEDVFTQKPILKEQPLIAPLGEQKAREYLSKLPRPKVLEKFERQEKEFLENVIYKTKIVSPAEEVEKKEDVYAQQPYVPPTSPFITQTTTQKITKPSITTKRRVNKRRKIMIPKNPAIHIASTPAQKPKISNPNLTDTASQPGDLKTVTPVFITSPIEADGSKAMFVPQAAPPNPPDKPNIVVGQVLASDGKIVEGAILEVKKVGGPPVRALKTNKVGHFLTVTPLHNGDYEIITEKEGMKFDIVRFKAEGKIIPPIEIRAKTQTNETRQNPKV